MREMGGSPGNLRNGKMYTFEGGMRVPTLAMLKGLIPEGIESKEIASQLDWFPTFASITNSEIPKNLTLDGIDIRGVLRGNSIGFERDYLFFDYERLEAYRRGVWKIKLPYEGWPGTWYKSPIDAHDTLLFNLREDPGEKNNIFESNKVLARNLANSMIKKYNSMGKLPKSIVIRNDADESHLRELNIKK
jgi:arylsulfatase A-like enzyme